MLLDNSLNLDITVALTTTGSSTNYIDTIGASGGQAQISGINTIQGGGDAYEQLWWEVVVTTTVTGAGGFIDFQLWTSSVVAQIWTTGNAGSQPTTSSAYPTTKLASTGSVAVALLSASSSSKPGNAYTYKTRIAQGIQRYIAGFYAIQGPVTGLTAGAWTSVLVPDVDINLT